MKWQPFETMPDVDTAVVVTDGKGRYFADVGKQSDLWMLQSSRDGRWRPTHWAPLEPPEKIV